MILYISIILISMMLIMLFNIIFGVGVFDYSPIGVVLLVCFATIIELILDLIQAGIIESLPSKIYDPNKKIFCVGKKERKFYEKLGIRKWKDRIMELGFLAGFRKNKISEPSSPEYLQKFLIESNKGIIAHIFNIVLGFLVIVCMPLEYWLVISLPVALVNFVLGLLPIFVLRYNIPKLKIALQRAERNKKNKDKKEL